MFDVFVAAEGPAERAWILEEKLVKTGLSVDERGIHTSTHPSGSHFPKLDRGSGIYRWGGKGSLWSFVLTVRVGI
jgi:hypothetical protein